MDRGTNNALKGLNNKLDQKSQLSDLQDEVLNKLAIHRINWKLNLISPFANAYTKAYNKFKQELDKRANAQKAKAEFAMFALSLVGGSVITALLSRVNITAMLDDVILNALAKKNMERTFTAYATARTSPAAAFILDESIDKASKWATKQTIKAIKDADKFSSTINPTEPGILARNLQDMYLQAEQVMRFALDDILSNSSKLTYEQKVTALNKIKNSSFCSSPMSRVYREEKVLIDRIEFSFYLKMIINSDYTQSISKIPTKHGLTTSKGARVLIATSAANKAYPSSGKPISPVFPSTPYGKVTSYSSVGYGELGDNICKEINRLCKDKKVWSGADGKDLIDDGFFTHASDRKINAKVERILNQMNEVSIREVSAKISKRKFI